MAALDILFTQRNSGDTSFAIVTAAGTASRLFGTSASSVPGLISIGSGLSLSGGILSATGGGSGDVVGPASSVNNDLAAFDGTTGKLLKTITIGSGLTLVGSTLETVGGGGGGDVTGPASSTLDGIACFADTTGKVLKEFTGPLLVELGGTGQTSASDNAILIGLGGSWVPLIPSNAGDVLTFDGSDLTYSRPAAISSIGSQWDLQGETSAASALDATRHLNVEIDGVPYKIALIT